ncbi:MAG: hypothetical protein AAB790_03560 [Patescibacteria group bacterium]
MNHFDWMGGSMKKDANWEAQVAQESIRLEELLAGSNISPEELEKRKNKMRGERYPPFLWQRDRRSLR